MSLPCLYKNLRRGKRSGREGEINGDGALFFRRGVLKNVEGQ
jgi:hypothetical protein